MLNTARSVVFSGSDNGHSLRHPVDSFLPESIYTTDNYPVISLFRVLRELPRLALSVLFIVTLVGLGPPQPVLIPYAGLRDGL